MSHMVETHTYKRCLEGASQADLTSAPRSYDLFRPDTYHLTQTAVFECDCCFSADSQRTKAEPFPSRAILTRLVSSRRGRPQTPHTLSSQKPGLTYASSRDQTMTSTG